jgi:uncharacterized protein
MPWIRCPICRESFDTRKSRALPFCSERCRLIDLGRWLNEEHGIPIEEEDDEPPPPEDTWRSIPR